MKSQDRFLSLTLTAIGVVYGDIGTSPLYTIRECFFGEHGVQPTHDNVLGVLSLIIYSLVLVVSVKYIAIVMRADNEGEGGILALMALMPSRPTPILLGLFGAALLYGDGMITPAISVLGALQGVTVRFPTLHGVIVPAATLILIGVFSVQQFGTARVGGTFGPIMAIWFATISYLGIREILIEPRIFAALNPWYAVEFFQEHGFAGFVILGAVVLVITGGEALYADMG